MNIIEPNFRATYGYYILNGFHVSINDLEGTIKLPDRRRIRKNMRVINIYNHHVSENDSIIFYVYDSIGNVYPCDSRIKNGVIVIFVYPPSPTPKKLGAIIVQFRIIKERI